MPTDSPRPFASPAPTWRRRWLCAAALLTLLGPGCTAIDELINGKPKVDAGPAKDPCDDDPYGTDCPCALDPTLAFCPDPCEPVTAFCAADASDAGATIDASETTDGNKTDAIKDGDAGKAEVLDVQVEEVFNDDVDAMRFVPDGSVPLPDGGIKLPDGQVVNPGEVLASQDLPQKDVEPEVEDSATDAEQEIADGDASPNAEVVDGETSGGSDVVDTTDSQSDVAAADIDIGPPPKCLADKDCVGPAKACKSYKCLYSPQGEPGCYYVDIDSGAICDDGKHCTILDHCEKGACVGKPKYCPELDNSVCSFPVCDELALGCTVKFVDANLQVPCTDYNECTDGDVCVAGKCKSGQQNKCQCNKNSDCASYDDGNQCNGNMVCKNSECVIDPATVVLFKNGVPCDPGKDSACKVNTCIPATGKCELLAVPNGTACSDDSACTVSDLCIDGACKGTSKADSCNDNNLCTDDSCDKTQGCVFAPNQSLCNDGDACSDNDVCNLGKCAGTAKKVCECKTGADCVKYEDGNTCNGTMICKDFACILDPKTVVTCPPGSPCAPQTCDPKKGSCDAQLLSAGIVCSDGDLCTVNDSCDGKGFCKPGTLLNCNDKNPCTKDSCTKDQGCVFEFADNAPCTDFESCTYPDVCQKGACKAGPNECECNNDDDCAAKVAKYDKCKGNWTCVTDGIYKCKYDQLFVNPCKSDPNNPCKAAECVPDTGKCVVTTLPENSSCNDGKFCTVLDRCINGVCYGDPNSCDDGKYCTADSCDSKAPAGTACVSEAVKLDGVPCSDGSACTKQDLCQAGTCVGLGIDCDDLNVCTADSCNKQVGCVYAPMVKGAGCDDGNACSGDPGNTGANFIQDGCDGSGKCKGGDPKVCVATEACVDIPCNPTGTAQPGIKLGCEQKVYTTDVPCNDGDSCTTGEACQIGLCTGGTPTTCDDINPCTVDACDKLTGCKHSPTVAPCDDGQACTYGDACDQGKCIGKPKTCDDENICTKDSCDTKTGCVHIKGDGDCGDFATCSTDVVPKCVFKGGSHLLITEVFVGNPGDPKDDWVEIHNPSNGTAKLEDYVLEVRAVDAEPEDPWKVIATGKKGLTLPPHGYALFGNGTVAQGGIAIDVTDAAFDLELALAAPALKKECFVDSKRHAVLRVRDVPHVLEHDRVAWNDGQAAKLSTGVTPLDADPELWPSWASIERRASAQSDNSSMYPHKSEWLAGNSYDSGDCGDDFYTRYWPEPYNKAGGKYEPACNNTCALTMRCNFDPKGEKCILDSECKSFGVSATLACGNGKICEPNAAQCIPDQGGTLVVSEIHFGSDGEQFVELYNSSSKPLAVGGWRIQRKDVVDAPFKPWILQLAVIAAGTVIPAKRYFTLGTQSWGRVHGQLDQVLPDGTGLKPEGGALRIWDPGTDTEMDLLGWGNAATYSFVGIDGLHKAAPTVEIGQSLHRKANAKSTDKTMAEGGTDSLAGNGSDTGFDNNDFYAGDPDAQTLASGVYEPACAGTCQIGYVCNYLPQNEKCVDPLCGIPCPIGRGCNPKTLACDYNLLIAEFATDGPSAKTAQGAPILPANNEYVVLYNPSPSTIQTKATIVKDGKPAVDALALRYKAPGSTSFTNLTETNPAKPQLPGPVPPYSYYLVVPVYHDATLPKADYVSNLEWGMQTGGDFLQIVRTEGTYENGKNETDRVAFGGGGVNGENKTAVPPQIDTVCNTGINGALRRKALSVLEGAQVGDPLLPQFFVGAGLDTNDNKADWTRIPKRMPRSTKCTWPGKDGGSVPLCVGYNVQQRP